MAASYLPFANDGSPEPLPQFQVGPVRAWKRAAWLLRVSRALGAEAKWMRANQFTAAFHGGRWQKTICESQLSRWETGRLRVPYGAVRRYEELLELPDHSLVSVIDLVNRYAAPPVGSPSALIRGWNCDRSLAVERLYTLLDKFSSGELMSGTDWDELSAILSDIPDIVLAPRSLWADLAGRLVAEMVIADGLSWMQRFESLNRLLGHPIGQQHTIGVCASIAASKRNQVVVEVIAALDGTNHPDASHHVVAQLSNPTSGPAFYGAFLACLRKTRHGHLAPHQVQRLVRIANELLAGPGRNDPAQTVAVQILRELPGLAQQSLSSRARRSLASSRAMSDLLRTGSLAAGTSSVVMDRVLAKVAGSLPRELPGPPDRVLPELIHELLFCPSSDTRLYTAMLLRASPYQQPLAAALGEEFTGGHCLSDTTLSCSVLDAMRVLAAAQQRGIVERLILAPGLPAAIAVSAAHAIGHVPGTSRRQFWSAALSRWSRAWAGRGDPSSASVLHDLVYALGISNDERALAAIRDQVSAPPPVRAAAAWWLALPHQIRASAAR